MDKKLPRLLKEHEPELLLRATTRQRDRLMLLILLYAGLRAEELCNLRVEHLDFRADSLFVEEGKGKRDRLIPLARCLQGPLRGWVAGRQTGPVFPSRQGGGHLTTRALQYLFTRLAKKAQLADPSKAHPHAFRHAFAVRCLSRGVNLRELQLLLGHSSIATTQKYLHLSPEQLRGAINRLL